MARLRPLWLELDALAERVRATPQLWVATDFDGTLTPIVRRPELATLDRRGRGALRRLRRLPGVHLAVLSGRKLADLKRRLHVPGAYLVGSTGLETLQPGHRRQVHLPRPARMSRTLHRAFEAWCRRFPGAWLEDKRLAIALHYREVPLRFRDAFGQGVRRRVRLQRGALDLIHGKMVFEIMPSTGIDKAVALTRWLPEPGEATVFYFGDDTNDEPVHGMVRDRGGVAVAVGRTASRAEYALPSPGHVVWFLEWLAREWESRGARR